MGNRKKTLERIKLAHTKESKVAKTWRLTGDASDSFNIQNIVRPIPIMCNISNILRSVFALGRHKVLIISRRCID